MSSNGLRGGRPSGSPLIRVLLLSSMMSSALGSAQTLSGPVLKAAFLYNLTKVTEWPADTLSPKAPLEFCVIAAPDTADALQSLVTGHMLADHPLVVRGVTLNGVLRGCHVLYAAGLDHQGSLKLLDLVRGLPVLTITDNEEFAELGGVANFFLERDNTRFAINLGATERARLKISSRVLTLAKIVKDRPMGR
jgi:hypothetical protein